MRLLAAAAAATLLLATGAWAQNYETPSDSYVCNHGDQAAQATQDACARLRGDSGPPAAPVTTPAPEGAAGGFETVGPMAVAPNPSAATPAQVAAAATPKVAAPAPAPTDVGEAPVNAAPDMTANAQSDQGDEAANVSVGGHWFHWITTLGIVAVAFLLFAGMAIYFLPSVIAAIRQKRNAFAIFMLNLLLGWSFVGWVVALVWSFSAEPPR